MRIRHIAAVAVAVLSLASASRTFAARSLVANIPTGTTARYAVSVSNGGFVLVTSGSAGVIQVVDGRSFSLSAATLTLSSGATAAKSLAAGGSSTTEYAAAGTSNGKAERWNVADIVDYVDGFLPRPTPTVFATANSSNPITGVAIGAAGARVFAADGTGKTVTAFDGATTTPVSGAIALGHTPLNALDVNTSVQERVFFGTDDGFLAWIDATTFNPVATNFDATQTHDYTGLAVGTFTSSFVRMAVIDATASSLLLIDPAGPTLVNSISLGSHPVGVAISGSLASATIWVAEDNANGGPNQVEAFDGSLAATQTAIALPAAPVSLTEGNGWLYAGLADGTVAVITDHPYVDITSVSPNPLHALNTAVTVTFTSTETGSAVVKVNGSQVATGTVATAGTPVTITIPASSVSSTLLSEGSNRLRVEVSGGTSGLVGHDESNLKLDLPPPTPTGFTVGFGDGRVIAFWDPVDPFDVPDFKDYVVRFGTGAAGTNGVPGLSSPVRITSDFYVVDVTNGTTVFMSVMSEDSSGNLSSPTAVLSATAQPTAGAADLAGDKGGFMFSCRVGPAGSLSRALASLLGFGVALLSARGFFRRRRREYP